MNIKKTLLASILVAGATITTLTGCASDAATVSQNLSTAADQFEINRRIVFFNGITDKYLLVVEGRCSISADAADAQLEVTCRLGQNQYKKHFLGLSDNVSYFVEQLEVADASVYHYRVLFKPEAIIPDIDLEVGKQ